MAERADPRAAAAANLDALRGIKRGNANIASSVGIDTADA